MPLLLISMRLFMMYQEKDSHIEFGKNYQVLDLVLLTMSFMNLINFHQLIHPQMIGGHLLHIIWTLR